MSRYEEEELAGAIAVREEEWLRGEAEGEEGSEVY